MKIQIKTLAGSLVFEGDFTGLKEAILAALKSGADLTRADLAGADLAGAYLTEAYLTGAHLTGAHLTRADLTGADLAGADLAVVGQKITIKSLRVFTGLYKYPVWSVLAKDSTRYVKMGCLFKSLDDWKKIGILKSNENEFPNDGSDKSLERQAAFEFAKAAALQLK